MLSKNNIFFTLSFILCLIWILVWPLNKNTSLNPSLFSDNEVISALHHYKDGVHVIVGNIELADPCQDMSVETIVRESKPEQVTILFSTESSNDMCIQVVSLRQFEVKFEASRNASINALLNGAPMGMSLVSADSNDILKFKLNINK